LSKNQLREKETQEKLKSKAEKHTTSLTRKVRGATYKPNWEVKQPCLKGEILDIPVRNANSPVKSDPSENFTNNCPNREDKVTYKITTRAMSNKNKNIERVCEIIQNTRKI